MNLFLNYNHIFFLNQCTQFFTAVVIVEGQSLVCRLELNLQPFKLSFRLTGWYKVTDTNQSPDYVITQNPHPEKT